MRRKNPPAYAKALDKIFIVQDVPRVRFDFYAVTTDEGKMDTRIRLTPLSDNASDLLADSAEADPRAYDGKRLDAVGHTVMVITADEWLDDKDNRLRQGIETIDKIIAERARPSGPA